MTDKPTNQPIDKQPVQPPVAPIKDKSKKEKQYIPMPQFNSVESAMIGEIGMTSEVLRSDQLLSLIMQSLRDEEVKKYLRVLGVKKRTGGYVG